MTRHIITILAVILASGTTAYAAQNTPDAAADASANSSQTQTVVPASSDDAADTQAASKQNNPSFWDKTGAAIANTGNTAMDMGSKAWDSAGETASQVGDKAVDVGHSAMDTTSDVITTVSDSVTGALGMDSKKASDADAVHDNDNATPEQAPQAQTPPQPAQDESQD